MPVCGNPTCLNQERKTKNREPGGVCRAGGFKARVLAPAALASKISKLSDDLKKEVIYFIDFLIMKKSGKNH